MSASVVSFTAVRTARMLRENAPPHFIDNFLASMTLLAREQSDVEREAFWRDVATLVGREGAELPA